jgi:Fimbrial assembly protein (PilN)
MREINFLPDWYPRVVRQRRMLTLQAYATALLVTGGLVALMWMKHKTVRLDAELNVTQAKALDTVKAVHQLNEMLDLQKQLVAKKSIVGELGLPVELSRVITEMGACTPREVTITSIDANTIETAAPSIADRAVAAASGKSAVAQSRRLDLKLRGVAPTEAEVTALWSRLIERPFLSQVRLVNSTEKVDGEHKMREFEMTLSISLDAREGA